jgi:hypothetical protein
MLGLIVPPTVLSIADEVIERATDQHGTLQVRDACAPNQLMDVSRPSGRLLLLGPPDYLPCGETRVSIRLYAGHSRSFRPSAQVQLRASSTIRHVAKTEYASQLFSVSSQYSRFIGNKP